MPPSRDWPLRVRDVLAAVDRIARYTAGMTQEQFARDEKTVEAVCFALVVIGEAASHVSEEDQARAPTRLVALASQQPAMEADRQRPVAEQGIVERLEREVRAATTLLASSGPTRLAAGIGLAWWNPAISIERRTMIAVVKHGSSRNLGSHRWAASSARG